jgi:diacylglycerol kinase (ATP)
MKTDILVIVNPASGGGRARRIQPRIAAYLAANGASARFVHSRSSEDLRNEAARGASEGCRYVVALGGDGTFHHVVEGLRGTDAVAGFFPAGNGNDIARPLGIPANAMGAARAFFHSKPRPVDLVRVTFADGRTAHFIGAGGVGLDAEAAHMANTRFRRFPGITRYLAGALWSFLLEQPIELRAKFDDQLWSGRALFAAIANGTSYGAGVRIAPEAKMDDGWLDAVVIGELGWLRLLRALPVVLTSGNLQRFKEVHRFRCRHAVLETDRPAKIHGDGELLGESPAEFQILPGAIQVMTLYGLAGDLPR